MQNPLSNDYGKKRCQWSADMDLKTESASSQKKEDLKNLLSIFFLRRGQTMNQTTRAVSTAKPNEMSRVPHQGILSNPSTEGPPGQTDTQREWRKGSFNKQGSRGYLCWWTIQKVHRN